MRTSRVSKETAKLFENAASLSPPRRTTRSSLARFSYATDNAPTSTGTPDIEDAVASPARKRRRVTTDTVKAEILEQDVDLSKTSSPPKPKTKAPSRTRKPARKVTDPSTGETLVTAPSDWEEMYKVVQEMRAPGGAAYGAAVDTMGCERLADTQASPRDQRFHTLIALMLSSQTKDTVNAVAMAKLKKDLPPYKDGAPPGLNLENILAVEPAILNDMIWAVGFHNNKTKYIKKTAEILRDTWKGDIPDTIEGLTSLPGVGPKMAYLCLSAAWNRTEGIGVDVHVHRITNLWGWHKTNTPEDTRHALQSWLPRDRWRQINGLLVGLGQAVCLPQGRRCGDCELGLRGLCKAADRGKVLAGRRAREDVKAEKKEEDEEESAVKIEVKTEIKPEVVKQEVAVKKEEE